MPAPPQDARSRSASVVRCTPCGADAFVLELDPGEELAPVRASRFFMLRREDGTSPLIPRPFSLYRQRRGNLEFLIKVMGAGTQALVNAPPGSKMRLIGPLGNGWPAIDGDGPDWVMLAGGVGSAPFWMGIEQALGGMDGKRPARRNQVHLLLGAATSGLLYDLAGFQELGAPVHAATMDGSCGHQGHVLSLLAQLQATAKVPQRVRLLACGPERMLEAASHLALERGWDAWLSMETWMGCGVGICNGCPIPTRAQGPRAAWPNVKCCVEGPVFHVREVDLERRVSAAEMACSPAAS